MVKRKTDRAFGGVIFLRFMHWDQLHDREKQFLLDFHGYVGKRVKISVEQIVNFIRSIIKYIPAILFCINEAVFL